VENMNQVVKRVLGSVFAERCLIGKNPNWTEVLGIVAATINSQYGRGKHDVSTFEVMYGQTYHPPLLCSKKEAGKCWTLPDHLRVINDEAFATYIAQHFHVRDEKYTSTFNTVTDNESGHFSEEELSKSEEQEVSDDYRRSRGIQTS
jgi:hypothetical protein